MNARTIPLIGIALIGVMMTSCEKEQLSEWQTTNDGTVYYRTSVQPMIDNSCIDCHDPSAELPLYSYESVVESANSGHLQKYLTGTTGNCHIPEYLAPDAATVNDVLLWIEQGFQE